MSDNWDFYPCRVDDKPASIFVDLGIRADVPIGNLVDLTWLRLNLQRPRDDGLTTRDEFQRLCEIEDALSAAIGGADIQIAYVGRNTSDGTRDFYFYSSDRIVTQSILSSAMVPFSEYEFESDGRHDPEWRTYLDFLYPSERSYQMILNGRVLSSLEKRGDNHLVERDVEHWIYFDVAENRNRFRRAALELGFKVASQRDDAPKPRRFGISVMNCTPVDYNTINNAVLQLFDLSKEFDGDYDGWETSVERDGGAA
jgi:regulator of RNase E activity RraB